MTVHVDEVHAEVIPSGPSGSPTPPAGPEQLGAAQEKWLESRGFLDALARRVAAAGFDD
ncbi:MAG: hypothetical protein ACJ74U_18095 [Jatrophihabitantaceae bacterium]